MCHDVLVSSFLCPIGSVFSQKLLTCDWWTKVDCSASSKYIDVNRNSYQQDDDEMIRNAYAMISLQSGTDVTKDGLVDPDRTGSVVDYQRGPGRILDYSSVDTTGNDLRTNFEDYRRPANRDFLPPYQLKDKKPETSGNYQGKFYSSEKFRSPYEDSPIIRVQKINDPGFGNQRNKDFQETYRRPNEFTNQFQPSYAPTVPTVTTTTRRFYSPTVPTTFKSSTLAYNKLDQAIDSSEYYLSRSRSNSFVTPPTRVFSNDDKSRQDLGRDLKISEAVSLRKPNRDDDYSRQESYEYDYDDVNSDETRDERPKERFQVRVLDDFNYNRTKVSNGGSSLFDRVYAGFNHNSNDEEPVDDFETRGSIGLGHAFHQSFRGISVDEQNPARDETKVYGETQRGINFNKEDTKYTLVRPEPTRYPGEKKEETTEQYQRNDQRDTKTNKEEFLNNFNTFPSTTASSIIESTIKATTNLHEPRSSISNGSSDLNNSTDVNSEFFNEKHPIDTEDSGSQTSRPVEFLESLQKTQNKFQIKVPDLPEGSTLFNHYATQNDEPSSRTTEIPRFQSIGPDDYVDQSTSFDRNIGVTSNYGNVEISEDSSLQNHGSTVARPLVPSTGSWFSSSFSDQSNTKSPTKDYTRPEEGESHTNHFDLSFKSTNDTEEKLEDDKKSELRFTTDDAVQNSRTISVSASTVSPPKIIKAITSSGFVNSSGSVSIIKTPEELSTQGPIRISTSPVTKSIDIESSISTFRPVTHRSIESGRSLEEKSKDNRDSVESSTVNALLGSIMPETLKHIEEAIEKNNSPYQVTLTMNKGAELIPTGQDIISKLIAQQGKETSTLNDEVHELEIIKSLEPEVHRMTELQISAANISDVRNASNFGNDFINSDLTDFKRNNPNTVSLLQLMSELMKQDRVPRPFSLSVAQNSELQTVNSNVQQPDEATFRSQESSTLPNLKTSAPRSKEGILGQLEQHFGEPLYREQKKIFDLPEKQKSIDFQTVVLLRNTNKYEQSSTDKTIVPILQTSSKIDIRSTTTSTPKTTFTTKSEKTVVKTEFVPSIGFSFDTDEGREEYVEAVLGGLIEPQAAESQKKEIILKEKPEGETFLKKNETTKSVQPEEI